MQACSTPAKHPSHPLAQTAPRVPPQPFPGTAQCCCLFPANSLPPTLPCVPGFSGRGAAGGRPPVSFCDPATGAHFISIREPGMIFTLVQAQKPGMDGRTTGPKATRPAKPGASTAPLEKMLARRRPSILPKSRALALSPGASPSPVASWPFSAQRRWHQHLCRCEHPLLSPQPVPSAVTLSDSLFSAGLPVGARAQMPAPFASVGQVGVEIICIAHGGL